MSEAADRALAKLDRILGQLNEASEKVDELRDLVDRSRSESPSFGFIAFWLGFVPAAAIFVAGMVFLV